MKRFIPLLFLLPMLADAGTLFYRAHDADSVIIGPVCVPELAGEEHYAPLDFDTSGLTVTIYASGDGVDSSFVYTGGNIDDYDGTPPAWGNPAASAIEVEADDDCVRVHIRDEVLAVTNATEWTMVFSDGGTLIMDWEVQVLALADSTDNQADVNAALVALQLDHWANQAMVGTDVTDNSFVAQLLSKSATADFDSYDNETDSLEATRDALTTVDNEISTAQLDLDDLTDALILYKSTCDSGSTTTCVDATLTQADNYWNGVGIVFTDDVDSIIDQQRCVYSFTATTPADTLTFRPATTSAVATSAYALVFAPTCGGVVAP